MKNLGKKLSMIILALTLLACSVFAIACSKQLPPKPPEIIPTDATLSHDSLYLEVGEEFQLTVNNAEGSVSWSSANTNVVTVDQSGKVKAVEKGNTLVTATIGESSLSCDVLVIGSENIPTLTFSGIEEVALLLNDSYTLEPKVFFDGKYYDAEYNFSVYDQTIASITEDGVITALAYGETEVEVKATWKTYSNDLLLTETIPVKVNKDVYIKTDLNRTEIYIEEFTAQGVNYYDKAELTSEVKVEGVEYAGQINYVSSNEQVAIVDNGEVKAVSAGVSEVYIEFTIDGEKYTSNPLKVTVKKPFETTGKKFLLSREDKNVAFDGVAEGVVKTRMISGSNVLEVAEFTSQSDTLTFSGENLERVKSTSATMVLETATKEYYYDLTLADVMIEDRDDFALFIRDIVKYTGKCVGLANDLDFAGYDYTAILGDLNYSDKYVPSKSENASAGLTTPFNAIFSCVLDGGGHVIKNLDINGYLFHTAQKATVQNIGFVNANYTSAEAMFICQLKMDSGETKFENVYFHSIGGGTDYDLALTQIVYAGSSFTLNNSIIDRTHTHTQRLSLFGNVGGSIEVNNSYSIGNSVKITYLPSNYTEYKEMFINKTMLCEMVESQGLNAEDGWNLSAWTYADGKLKFGTAQATNNPKTVINDAQTLQAYFENTDGAYDGKWVVLGQDIDMTGYALTGNGVLSGVFDGQGHVISNISYSTAITTPKNATIKNVGFLVTKITTGYSNGLFGGASNARFNNVYVKAVEATGEENNGVVHKDYALFSTLTGSVTLENVIVDKKHSALTTGSGLTGCLVYNVQEGVGSNALNYNNLYSIGDSTKLTLTTAGIINGTGTVIYPNDGANALVDITVKGLTKPNGWNTDVWKITAKGDLMFGSVTAIKVSSALGSDEYDFDIEDSDWILGN